MNIPLNIDWQQILLHLLNFVILAGGLYLLLYKPVKTFMEKRQQYYQEQDAKAAKTLADAEKTAAEVRQQLKNADADAAAKLAAAQKSADAAMQRQLSDARTQVCGTHRRNLPSHPVPQPPCLHFSRQLLRRICGDHRAHTSRRRLDYGVTH